MRILAWMNSICLLFILVGVAGLRFPLTPGLPMETLAPARYEVVEMMTTPPPVPSELRSVPPETAAVEPIDRVAEVEAVRVTAMAPEVVFSVPTVGDVVVAQALAVAPALDIAGVPHSVMTPGPVDLAGRLGSRFFPRPEWTTSLLRARVGGLVVLHIQVDKAGKIVGIEVKQSTGYRQLDEHTIQHVRRRFVFPAGQGMVVYELPVQWENPLQRK